MSPELEDNGYPTVRRDRQRRHEELASEVRYLWNANGTLAAQRFAPDAVTVEAGGVTLTTDYEYWGTTTLPVSISRTGPHGPLTTTISRDGYGNPQSTTAPDQTTTTQTFDPSGVCEAVELTVDGRVSARRWRDGADGADPCVRRTRPLGRD